MNLKQGGLGRRVAIEVRRLSAQHRRLDELYALLAAALGRGSARAARAAFLRFRDSLEAHFAMEDEVHFPALHGLRPDLEATLTAFVQEHQAFRHDLEALDQRLERGDLPEAGAALDRFSVLLAAHEGREEKLAELIRR